MRKAKLSQSAKQTMALRAVSQRLQRFFRNFELDYEAVAKVVVKLRNIPQPWVLSTDRTIAVGNPPAKLSNRRRANIKDLSLEGYTSISACSSPCFRQRRIGVGRLVIWSKTIQSSFLGSRT